MNKPADTTSAHVRRQYEAGCRLKASGNLKQAIAHLAQAIAEDPAFGEAYFMRGACFYLQGRYQTAANDFDAAALMGCQEALLWSRLGCFNETVSKMDELNFENDNDADEHYA